MVKDLFRRYVWLVDVVHKAVRLIFEEIPSGHFRYTILRKKWKSARNIPYSSILYPRPLISSRKFCLTEMRSQCLLRNIFAVRWQRLSA